MGLGEFADAVASRVMHVQSLLVHGRIGAKETSGANRIAVEGGGDEREAIGGRRKRTAVGGVQERGEGRVFLGQI